MVLSSWLKSMTSEHVLRGSGVGAGDGVGDSERVRSHRRAPVYLDLMFFIFVLWGWEGREVRLFMAGL